MRGGQRFLSVSILHKNFFIVYTSVKSTFPAYSCEQLVEVMSL